MTRLYLHPAVLAALSLTLLAAGLTSPLSWWAWPALTAACVLGGAAAAGAVSAVDPPDTPAPVVEAREPWWPAQDYDEQQAA